MKLLLAGMPVPAPVDVWRSHGSGSLRPTSFHVDLDPFRPRPSGGPPQD